MIDRAGVYDLSAVAYHEDPAPSPSLSSSLAKVLLERSPKHAWVKHPRLGGLSGPPASRSMALGTVAHSVILEGDTSSVRIVDAPNFRTKAAREQRDLAMADGLTPLLLQDWKKVQRIVTASEEAGIGDLLSKCRTERTALAHQDGAWYRCRPDAVDEDAGIIYDLKTTAIPGTPREWARRRIWEYSMQAGFYRSVWELVSFVVPRFVFIVQETDPPYAVSQFEFDPLGCRHADLIAKRAMNLWAACMESDTWLAYPEGIQTVPSPEWVVASGGE